MKLLRRRNRVALSVLTGLSILLLSFATNKGGEGFQIYLNSKLVLQQFGTQMNTAQSIQLDRSLASSELSVKYFHCGRPGKNRTITIRDDNNKTLREWHYPDVAAASLASSDLAMNFKVADVLSLQKSNAGKFNLYYSCSELPKGKLLATLVCENGMAKH